MFFKTKNRIEDDLDLYKNRRKLEIDEELSEWRRSQKNRAVDEIMAHTEEARIKKQKMFKETQAAEVEHEQKKAAYAADLATIEANIATKKALATQVDTDFESRGLLRDRACKAEKEKADAIITEKDKHIAHLEAHLKTVSEQNVGLLATLAKSLGDAAAKDAVTKVVGFGPSSEAKKV